MLQLNLLPAVKLDYIKTQKVKRSTMLIALVVAGASLAVFILLFLAVQVAQRKHIDNLTVDIKQKTTELQSIEDIEKIVTIQNQLNNLDTLHANKPVSTRLFDYLKQVTPANVSIATVAIDFETQTISLTGSAGSIAHVNTFVDTLKFTNYRVKPAGDAKDTEEKTESTTKAFSGVVLSSFGKDDRGASYQVTFKFEPLIFDSKDEIELQIPAGKITTRSQTEKPESLFQPLSNSEEEGEQ